MKESNMARGKAHPALMALCFCCVTTAVTAAPMGGIPRADGSVLVGDIRYSAVQWQSLLARNLDSIDKLWPKANGIVKIPYKISDPDLNVTLLKMAFSAWESETCVQFPEASDTDKEYLDITIGDDCSSDIGYTKNEVITVSIYGEPCNLRGVTHEFGHSMGLQHEQSRSDRDDHISVIWDNIMPGLESQFEKVDTINFDVPYDYSSVMQYQDVAAAKDDKRSMLTKDARFQQIIGNTEGISHMNLLLVNTMYNCTGDWLAACSKKSEPCKNFGYTKKDCSCACPLGTSGKNCENLDMSYNDALVKKIAPHNSVIDTNGAEVVSPLLSAKEQAEEIRYTQVMRAPKCQRAVVKFKYFNIEPRDQENLCASGSLEIRTDASVPAGEIFCGDEIKEGTEFKSNNSELIFHYMNFMYARRSQENKERGYKATFTTEPIPKCG